MAPTIVVRRHALLLLFLAAITGSTTVPSLGQPNFRYFLRLPGQLQGQVVTGCVGVSPSPGAPFCWLRRPSFGSPMITTKYYSGIGFSSMQPDTLAAFQSRNGFDAGGDVQGVYFNEGDLRLGRDMHCKQSGPKVACYVSNYGPPPFLIATRQPNSAWPNAPDALADVINGTLGNSHPFATVAMEFSPDPPGNGKNVTVRESDGATSNRLPVSYCPLVGNIIDPNGIPGVDVDTGIDVEPGDLVTFNVSGSIWAGFCLIGNTGPNGYGSPDPKYPLPSEAGFSLIGRVGAVGSYFFIGDGTQNGLQRAFPFPTGGRLFLRTNDDTPGNGSGAFSVTVTVDRQNVKFYVYDPNGDQLFDNVALDQEGPKPIPQMCMSCHGGTYNFNTDRATGASFLPFELLNFIFSQSPNFTRPAQEAKFRELNRLVTLTRSMDPTDPIKEMINKMYEAGPVAGALPVKGWKDCNGAPPSPPCIPGVTDHERLYNEFVRPYCRSCHAAARAGITFYKYEELLTNSNLNYNLCEHAEMPHAQVTYDRLTSARFDNFMAGELRKLNLSCVANVFELRLPVRRR